MSDDAPLAGPKSLNDRVAETSGSPTTAVAQRLLSYWQSTLNGRTAPRREDLLPEELGDLLPWVVLLDIVGSPPRFRVRLAGTGVVREYGAEITGRFLDELDIGAAHDRALEEHRRTVEECRPIIGTFDFRKQDGRWVTFERISLPLSADGETVNMLLCGARMHGAGAQAARASLRAVPRSVPAKWPS